MITEILCVFATIALLTSATIYLLVPLPLFSYQQGGMETDYGIVTKVEKIRPLVFEVSLTQRMEIDLNLQQGCARMISASRTMFVHFRKGQKLPEIGNKISVSSINRLHRFTGRSFNWAKKWESIQGAVPAGGRVELVRA